MTLRLCPPAAAWTAASLLVAGCAGAARGPSTAVEPVRPQPVTEADVQFMRGMIQHHAQAILIARWAPSHDAGPALRTLAERIVVSQRDEIALMEQWLREHPLPNPAGAGHHAMDGGDHALMPGMLSSTQLSQLDSARGPAFDNLFLRLMIQHHRGALTMVEQLMGSHGAAQEDRIFKFASDVHADQTSEIERMSRMLFGLDAGGVGP